MKKKNLLNILKKKNFLIKKKNFQIKKKEKKKKIISSFPKKAEQCCKTSIFE